MYIYMYMFGHIKCVYMYIDILNYDPTIDVFNGRKTIEFPCSSMEHGAVDDQLIAIRTRVSWMARFEPQFELSDE